MNYSGIIKTDFANGPGVRVTLFVSGCTLGCQGCHSPELHDFNHGAPFDDAAKEMVISAMNKYWIGGITITGGHPLEEQNIGAVYDLIKEVRERFPEKTVWLYTGLMLYPELFHDDHGVLSEVIRMCDIIVDGPYIETLRDTTLAFRGSNNQRIIDVKRTMMNVDKNKLVGLYVE